MTLHECFSIQVTKRKEETEEPIPWREPSNTAPNCSTITKINKINRLIQLIQRYRPQILKEIKGEKRIFRECMMIT
jgi:hypothetical protein